MINLSVIVPVYNVEPYLDECISSLVFQTEPFYEIILINDGSTDMSLKICRKYRDRCPNILLISQSNQGQAVARNVGLKKATGDYVIFVDADDYVKKETNAVIIKALRSSNAEILYYNADIRYDMLSAKSVGSLGHKSALNILCMAGIDYFKSVFSRQYTPSPCVAAYNMGFLRDHHITFPEGIYFEDNVFSLQALSTAKRISGIPDSLYVRRVRENSIMTSGMTEKKCRDLVTCQTLMWKYLAENPIWIKEKELLRNFIAFNLTHVFFSLSRHQGETLTRRLKDGMLDLFFQRWLRLFRECPEDSEANLAFFLVLKEWTKREYKALEADSVSQSQLTETFVREELEKVKKRVHAFLFKKLSHLPFHNEYAKIGIYGMGNHTDALLRLYEREIEDIRSELCFIVSSESEKRKGRTTNVFLCDEIPDDIEHVVVSSYVHQEEMQKNLLKHGINEENMTLLYTDTSICDLVLVDWAMNAYGL